MPMKPSSGDFVLGNLCRGNNCVVLPSQSGLLGTTASINRIPAQTVAVPQSSPPFPAPAPLMVEDMGICVGVGEFLGGPQGPPVTPACVRTVFPPPNTLLPFSPHFSLSLSPPPSFSLSLSLYLSLSAAQAYTSLMDGLRRPRSQLGRSVLSPNHSLRP